MRNRILLAPDEKDLGEADALRSQRRIPLVIGVTGHRELPKDEPSLALVQAGVRVALRKIVELCPRTPLVLLDSLAQGADQLVADIAMEPEFNATLIPVLPMDPTSYARHFGDDDREKTRAAERMMEFTDPATRHANVLHVVTLPPGEGDPDPFVGTARWIARHSQILLAMWNGLDDPEHPGGTAATVRFKMDGMPPDDDENARSAVSLPPRGPVLQIVTPRGSGDVKGGKPGELVWHYFGPAADPRPPSRFSRAVEWLRCRGVPEDSQIEPRFGPDCPKTFKEVLRLTVGFNTDVLSADGPDEAALDTCRDRVIPLETTGLPPEVDGILQRYAAADAWAIRHQGHRFWALRMLAVGVLVGIAGFEAYSHHLLGEAAGPWILAIYPVCLLVLTVLYWRHPWFRPAHDHHLDCRALAEGLRVQLYWRIAGIDRQVGSEYLQTQSSELNWIRYAIQSIAVTENLVAPGIVTGTTGAGVRFVRERWVQNQLEFFEKRHDQDHVSESRRDRTAVTILALSPLLALGHVLGAHFPACSSACLQGPTSWMMSFIDGFTCVEDPRRWTMVAVAMTLVGAAILRWHTEHRLFKEQARSYGWMAQVFRRAGEKLDDAIGTLPPGADSLAPDQVVKVRRVLTGLGMVALDEHSSWLITHRSRPMEIPAG